MYNRYVPRQDGTFQKNRIDSPPPQAPEPRPEPVLTQNDHPQYQAQSAVGFLRQLIPRNLDTGDLLIIVLLLLMAGDSEENRNSWLLTLALYLFL